MVSDMCGECWCDVCELISGRWVGHVLGGMPCMVGWVDVGVGRGGGLVGCVGIGMSGGWYCAGCGGVG
jgi:hypothetical protein